MFIQSDEQQDTSRLCASIPGGSCYFDLVYSIASLILVLVCLVFSGIKIKRRIDVLESKSIHNRYTFKLGLLQKIQYGIIIFIPSFTFIMFIIYETTTPVKPLLDGIEIMFITLEWIGYAIAFTLEYRTIGKLTPFLKRSWVAIMLMHTISIIVRITSGYSFAGNIAEVTIFLYEFMIIPVIIIAAKRPKFARVKSYSHLVQDTSYNQSLMVFNPENSFAAKSETSEKSLKLAEDDIRERLDSEDSDNEEEQAPPAEEVVKDNWGPLTMREKVSIVGFEEVYVTKGHYYIVYLIELQVEEDVFIIKRKYSEFKHLYDDLIQEFNVYFPEFPHKKENYKKDVQKLKKVMYQLDMLVKYLFENQIYSIALDTFFRSNKDVPYFGDGTKFDIAALAESLKPKTEIAEGEEFTELEIRSETDETSAHRRFSVFDQVKKRVNTVFTSTKSLFKKREQIPTPNDSENEIANNIL